MILELEITNCILSSSNSISIWQQLLINGLFRYKLRARSICYFTRSIYRWIGLTGRLYLYIREIEIMFVIDSRFVVKIVFVPLIPTVCWYVYERKFRTIIRSNFMNSLPFRWDVIFHSYCQGNLKWAHKVRTLQEPPIRNIPGLNV